MNEAPMTCGTRTTFRLLSHLLSFLLVLGASVAVGISLLWSAVLGGAIVLDLVRARMGLNDADARGGVWSAMEWWLLICVPIAILAGVAYGALRNNVSAARPEKRR